MQKKIIVLFNKPKGNTGGEIYNMNFFNLLSNYTSKFTIDYAEAPVYKTGISIRKLFTPFLELRLLKSIRGKDACFFNSTMAYRHFLLLLFTRLFYPQVMTFTLHHHFEYEIKEGVARKMFKFFEISFLKLSTTIIIPSPYTKKVAELLLPDKQISYIELSFAKNKKNVAVNVHKKESLLYVGTIEPRKGLHLLIEALPQLTNKHPYLILNIVGKVVDSLYYSNLLQKIEDYGIKNNVFFHGRVSDEDLQKLYSDSNLFVFPSLLEGYGMVLIEAMSYGLPVVAFNNSAIPYVVKNNSNGLLAENKNIDEFSSLIESIIDSESLRNKLSNGALNTFNSVRSTDDFEKDVILFAEKLLI